MLAIICTLSGTSGSTKSSSKQRSSHALDTISDQASVYNHVAAGRFVAVAGRTEARTITGAKLTFPAEHTRERLIYFFALVLACKLNFRALNTGQDAARLEESVSLAGQRLSTCFIHDHPALSGAFHTQR